MRNALSASPENKTASTGHRHPDKSKARLANLSRVLPATGRNVSGQPAPYHGYFYKILTRQGPAAPGGELDYVVNGKMVGGFALVAYPAEYRNSGVVTFMVSHEGESISEGPRPGHDRTCETDDIVQSSGLATGHGYRPDAIGLR